MQNPNFVFGKKKKKKKKHDLQKNLPSKHAFSKKHGKEMGQQTDP